MNLLLVISVEDITYWMVEWGVERVFPFPAKNWWDVEITSFRALGGWGTATNFWPYVPRGYYFLGVIILSYFLMSQLGGPKYGQIAGWIWIPFLIPFFIGFIISSDLTFYILLITICTFGYGWGMFLLLIKQKRKKNRKN
jgi:hypothetical protein